MRSETPAIQADFRPTPGPGASGEPLEALGVDLLPGSAIGVAGSTALLLALVGAAGAGEKWTAIVGMPSLGVAAAAEFGIDLRRLVLIPEPGPQAAGVLAAIIDGFDVVAAGVRVLGPRSAAALVGLEPSAPRSLRPAEMPTRLAVEWTTGPGGQWRRYLRQRRPTVRQKGAGESGRARAPTERSDAPGGGRRLRRVG